MSKLRIYTIIFSVLVLLCIGNLACYAISNYSIRLSANPQAIIANSVSTTTISADIKDSKGNPVADGTIVDFTTSLGIIERTARTAAGVARVRLQSGAVTGTAQVSAVVTNARAVAQITVDFLEIGTLIYEDSYISISSKKYLGFDVDGKMVDGAGGVRIYHRGLTIDAEEAQIDLYRGIIRAKPKLSEKNIVLRLKDKEVQCSALYYDYNAMNGVLLTPLESGVSRMKFRGRDLFMQPDDDILSKISFEFAEMPEKGIFIKAKDMIISPGKEIKIIRAEYFLDGQKVVSIPLQRLKLTGSGEYSEQFLSYGSNGLKMDLPIYYSLTANTTGALRIKHSEPSGWGYYSGNGGWQVDAQQEYNIGGSTDGQIGVSRLGTDEWGFRWNNRHSYRDDSQIYTYFDFPSHKDIYGTMDYTKPMAGYTMNFNLRANKQKDKDGNYFSSMYLQTKVKDIVPRHISYNMTGRLTYDQLSGNSRSGMGQNIGMQLFSSPVPIGSIANLTTSLVSSQAWGARGSGTTLFGSASLFRSLGVGELQFNYNYAWSNTREGYNERTIGTDLYLEGSSRWNAHFNANKSLSDNSLSAFGDISYMLRPKWYLKLLGTFQSFSSADYTDAQVALVKQIGRQDARLIWSKENKRIQFEFSALSN